MPKVERLDLYQPVPKAEPLQAEQKLGWTMKDPTAQFTDGLPVSGTVYLEPGNRNGGYREIGPTMFEGKRYRIGFLNQDKMPEARRMDFEYPGENGELEMAVLRVSSIEGTMRFDWVMGEKSRVPVMSLKDCIIVAHRYADDQHLESIEWEVDARDLRTIPTSVNDSFDEMES